MKIKQSIHSRFSLIFLAALICLTFVGCTNQGTTPENGTEAAKDSILSSYKYTSAEKLIADTAFLADELGYNPHDSHYGEVSCALCHNSAKDDRSELWCTSCHVGMKLPDEGWSALPTSLWEE